MELSTAGTTTANSFGRATRWTILWDAPAFGAYSIGSAYGLVPHRFGYGGIYAYDWDNGKIVWKYTAPAFSMYETPYTDANGTTVYSFNAGCQIADGKLYIYNTEHTPSQPITRGWGMTLR